MPTFQRLPRVANGCFMSGREDTATACLGKKCVSDDFCREFQFWLFDGKVVVLLWTSPCFLTRWPVSHCWWSFPTSDESSLPLAWLVGRLWMSWWRGVAHSCRIAWEGQWWKKNTCQEGAGKSSIWKHAGEELSPCFTFLNRDLIRGKWCREIDRGWNLSLLFLCAFRSLKFACQTWNATSEESR